MDEGPSRQRIEIELTEHAESSVATRWRRGRDTVDAPLPPEPDDAVVVVGDTGGPSSIRTEGSERRRLVMTTMAVAVIALFVGWAVGRSGGSEPDEASGADESSETTEPASSGDAVDDSTLGSTLPEVEPADLPATTRPDTVDTTTQPAPTTTVPGWVDSTVDVDPATAPIGLELIAATDAGLEVLDLTTGERSLYAQRPRTFGGPGAVLFAGTDWILSYSPEAQRATAFRGEAAPEDEAFGSNQQIVYQRGAEVFTTLEQLPTSTAASPMQWRTVTRSIDGLEPTGVVYELPPGTYAQSIDPAGGGLIVWGSGGGMYRIDTEGQSQRIASGRLLAIDATTIVAIEGGDTLDSTQVVVTDRVTGERRTVPLSEGSPRSFDAAYNYWGTTYSAVAPNDKDIVVSAPFENGYGFGLLSIVDGTFVPLSENYGESTVEWSPDGRYAVFLDNGKLSAYDTATGATLEDIAPFAEVRSFTSRPA